jgi:hypothetical protein
MVMFRLGVVTNVRDKQPLTKVVLFLQLHYRWRQYHRLLALKSVFLSNHTDFAYLYAHSNIGFAVFLVFLKARLSITKQP